MIGPRDAIERAILVSVGAASLTRERAEAIVDDLVHRGYLGRAEGKAMVDRLASRVRGEGPTTATGLSARLEGGVQGAFRELGLSTKTDLEELRLRVAELEQRVALLEGGAATTTVSPPAA